MPEITTPSGKTLDDLNNEIEAKQAEIDNAQAELDDLLNVRHALAIRIATGR